MERNLSIFNFRNIPTAFLISVVVFFVGQALLMQSKRFWQICYYHSLPVLDDGIRFQAQLRMLSKESGNKRIFLTGSSQTREDFDVDQLNRVFAGQSAAFYNHGISGSASPGEMFMIADNLVSRKPDVIVYMPFVGSFDGDFVNQKMKYIFDFSILPFIIKYIAVDKIYAQRNQIIDSLLAKVFLPFKYRNYFSKTTEKLFRICLLKEPSPFPRRFAYTSNMPPSYFKEEIKRSKGNRFNRLERFNMNREFFIHFADRILSSDIKLIVIDAPTHPLMDGTYKKEVGIRYHKFLLEQSEEMGFIFLDKHMLPTFTADDFIDFTHLNRQGRENMTSFMAEYFQKSGVM